MKESDRLPYSVNDIRIEEVPRPEAGANEAVIRITLTTICGTDLHILRGEYPVRSGLVIGHEPVGVIEELGVGVTGYKVGDRVLVGAITPCGQCRACLSGQLAQCGHDHDYAAAGGWRFGNTINGAQAEYLLVPDAKANLAKIPDELSDEQVVLLSDIVSTGFSGAESGRVRIGDSVVVFAQGPIGLCATAGARLMGAAFVIAVEGDPTRMAMARKMGTDARWSFEGRYSPLTKRRPTGCSRRCHGFSGAVLGRIPLQDKRGEGARAAQSAAQANELGELFAFQLLHAHLNVGKHAIPFSANRRPVVLICVFHDAPAAPHDCRFNTETARQRKGSTADLFHFGRVLCFHRDDGKARTKSVYNGA